MLKLELDWAGAEQGVEEPPSEDGVAVELVQEAGPGGGWPVYAVYAVDGPTLWAWLLENYAQDGDDASELAGMAESV